MNIRVKLTGVTNSGGYLDNEVHMRNYFSHPSSSLGTNLFGVHTMSASVYSLLTDTRFLVSYIKGVLLTGGSIRIAICVTIYT